MANSCEPYKINNLGFAKNECFSAYNSKYENKQPLSIITYA